MTILRLNAIGVKGAVKLVDELSKLKNLTSLILNLR